MELKDIHEFHAWFAKNYQAQLMTRGATFYQALMLAVARGSKTIVETGTCRRPGNWHEGQSTLILGSFAERYQCKVWSCDIEPGSIDNSRNETASYASHITYVVSDSVAFLQSFSEPIDLLYLDSMDFNPVGDHNPSQDHALREGQAALHALHDESIILIDDCNLPRGGKGGKVIPFLVEQGWQVIGLNYQVLLTRAFSGAK